MSFWVSAIRVRNPSPVDLIHLRANCTRIALRKDCWIYEGVLEALLEDPNRIEVLGEGCVDSLGGLSDHALLREFLSLLPGGRMPRGRSK